MTVFLSPVPLVGGIAQSGEEFPSVESSEIEFRGDKRLVSLFRRSGVIEVFDLILIQVKRQDVQIFRGGGNIILIAMASMPAASQVHLTGRKLPDGFCGNLKILLAHSFVMFGIQIF